MFEAPARELAYPLKTLRWPEGSAQSTDLWFVYSREQQSIADLLLLHQAGV
jgi:hypothetical protein